VDIRVKGRDTGQDTHLANKATGAAIKAYP
jgi:hypothetical protein